MALWPVPVVTASRDRLATSRQTGGLYVDAGATGTLTQTLGAATLTAAGTVSGAAVVITATLTRTLDDVGRTLAGTVLVTGTTTRTLASITLGATATAEARGTLTQTLAGVSLVATATAPVTGTLTRTLDPVALTAAGSVVALGAISGTLTRTLDSIVTAGLLTDDFNRASLGSGWNSLTGAWAITGSAYAAPTVGGATALCVRTESFPANHYAQCQTEVTSGDEAIGGVLVRCVDTDNYYWLYGVAGAVAIYKRVGGAETFVADNTSVSLTADTLNTLKLVATGTTLQAYLNGALVITTTDASLAAGAPGVFQWSGATQFARHDNFETSLGTAASITGTVLVAGTLTRTLDGVTLSAAGTVSGAAGITGTLTQTLADVGRTLAGTVLVTGTTTRTLGAVGLVATATVPAAATLSRTLDPIGRTLTATVLGVGTLTRTLDPVQLVATATAPAAATLTRTLDPIGLSASGSVVALGAISGTLTQTLGGIGLVATGTVSGAAVVISGTLTRTLDGVALSAAATSPITGTLSRTLASVTLTAAASSTLTATLTRTLDGVTLVATATAPAVATLTRTLDPILLGASGSVVALGAISGALTRTLADVGRTITGTVSGAAVIITATLTRTLEGITLTTAVQTTRAGTLTRTLADATLDATATAAIAATLTRTLAPVTLASTASAHFVIHATLTQILEAATLVGIGIVEESGLAPDPIEEQILGAIVSRLSNMATVLPGCWYPPKFVTRIYRPLDAVNDLPGYVVLRAAEESGGERQTIEYPDSAVIAVMGVEILAYAQGNDLEPTDRVLTRMLAQAERALLAPGLFGIERTPENQIDLQNTRRVLDHETEVGAPYRALMSHLYRARYFYPRGDPLPDHRFPVPALAPVGPDPLPEPIEEQILAACVARLTDVATVVPTAWYPPKFVRRAYQPLDAVNDLPGYLILRAPEESGMELETIDYPGSDTISAMGLEVLAYGQGNDLEPTDRVLIRLLAQAEQALCAPGVFGPGVAPENQIELLNTRRVLDHETEVGAPYRSLMSHLYRVRYLCTRGEP